MRLLVKYSAVIALALNSAAHLLVALEKEKVEEKVAETAKNIMTMEEAAEYLGISQKKLQYLTAEWSGLGMPFLKIGDQYIFTRSGIDKWLENNQFRLGN